MRAPPVIGLVKQPYHGPESFRAAKTTVSAKSKMRKCTHATLGGVGLAAGLLVAASVVSDGLGDIRSLRRSGPVHRIRGLGRLARHARQTLTGARFPNCATRYGRRVTVMKVQRHSGFVQIRCWCCPTGQSSPWPPQSSSS
jgi:hypothetical protein